MKLITISTSTVKPEFLKFEFRRESLEPVEVRIIIKELKSYSEGKVELPKTKHKNMPYLAVNLTHKGGKKERFCFAGPLAFDLLENIPFEKNGHFLIAYMRMESGKFIQMDPFTT